MGLGRKQLIFIAFALTFAAFPARAEFELSYEYPLNRSGTEAGSVFYQEFFYMLRGGFNSTSETNGLYIFSFKNPPNLSQTDFQPVGKGPVAMCIISDHLFLTGSKGELSVYSLARPATPRLVSYQKTFASGSVYSLLCDPINQRVYLPNATSKQVAIVNISNPSNPVVTNTFSVSAISPRTTYRDGNNFFVLGSTDNKLEAFDITNEMAPVLTGSLDTLAGREWLTAAKLEKIGPGRLVVTWTGNWAKNGISLVDTTDISDLKLLNQFPPSGEKQLPTGIILQFYQGFLFTSGYYSSDLTILDYSEIPPKRVRSTDILPVLGLHDRRITSVSMRGDWVIVTTGGEVTLNRIHVFKMNMFNN